MVTVKLLAAVGVAVALTSCSRWETEHADIALPEPSTILSGGTESAPFDPAAADAALHRDAEGWQFGAQPYPGVRITLPTPDGIASCGVTGGIDLPNGGRGLLTVWHCDVSDTVGVVPTAGGTENAAVSIGHYGGGALRDRHANVAVVELDPGVELAPDAGMVAGLRITGVMPQAEVAKLPDGTPICVSAARTGVQCGPSVGTVSDMLFVNFPRQLQHGDSGSPLFIAHDDGTATLVAAVEISGIVRGPASAQIIATDMDRLGVKVVTG